MSFISTVPVNSAGPVSNALPVAVMQAMGAAGANPTAKLLLPQAVTAAVLVPSFANETPRAPGKVLPRITTNQPLSTLTAQLLAQAPENATEQPAVFAPRTQVNPQQTAPQQEQQQATPITTNAAPRAGEAVPAPATPSAQNTPQTATNAVATVLPFVAPTTTNALRKPAAEPTGNSSAPLQSKERANSSATRGLSAYQSASRMTDEKSQYAIEAVG